MKTIFITAASAAMILLNGCSKTPEPGAETKPAAEQRAGPDAYQAALPMSFASKDIQPGGRCFVDSFNGQTVSPRNEAPANEPLAVNGWAIDAAGTAAPFLAVELASMSVTQSYYAPARRATRSGLGQALNNPALDAAGLDSTAALNGVPPGSYSVKLLIGGDKSATRCDPNLLLVVK
jgi:hypothetical protein